MRGRAGPPARAIVLGIILLAAAWAAPLWLDGMGLAEAMLRENHSLPELMPSYVPELRGAIQLGLAITVGVPLAAFVTWVAGTAFARPTGPGQVATGWRLVSWLVLCLLTAGIVYGLVQHVTPDSVDEVFAKRAALVLAAVAAALFWAFCLLGTERMIRPAVPGGALLVGRS